MTSPLKHLPIRTYYRDIELSPEGEALLLEAMNRLKAEDPDDAIRAALELFLDREQP